MGNSFYFNILAFLGYVHQYALLQHVYLNGIIKSCEFTQDIFLGPIQSRWGFQKYSG